MAGSISTFPLMSSKIISIITSLYRADDFLNQYLQHTLRISNASECELILIHNDPTEKELEIIRNYRNEHLDVVHVKVEREGLYCSWNRAIKIARGKYLAIWNVDDIRTADSLLLQKKALDKSNAVMCYGDFYASKKYGEHKDVFYQYGEYGQKVRKEALERHIVGGFPMWKKEIHEKIGYFDEQFRLVADWEFQIRTALNYDLVKAKEFLGYFLADVPHKLSSNRPLQATEQTVVQIRYRIYNNILVHYLPGIKRFEIRKVLFFGIWHNLGQFIPANSFNPAQSLLKMVALPFYYITWFFVKAVAKMYKIILR